jgi:hypothetical protein
LNVLKHPYFSTLLTCLLAVPAASWALGLGDIKLQSYLGQPLKASIDLITSPEEEFEEKCFDTKPGSDSGLPNVEGIKITLQKNKNRSRLLLTSRRPINEPAVAISVVTDCPQHLARQYLVLIDPPVIAEAPVVSDTSPNSAVSAMPGQAATQPQKQRITSDRKAHREKPTSPTRMRRPGRTHGTGSGPRLVLSGHSASLANIPTFGLRMDKSLPEPGKYKEAPPNPTDISDENASLNHKLAYLEQQLTSLQHRNAELEKAALNVQPVKPTVRGNTYSWLSWLLALALLAAGTVLATQWRRKRKAIRLYTEEELWSPPTTVANPAPILQMDPLPATPDQQVAKPLTDEKTVKPAPQSALVPPVRTIKWKQEDGVEVDDSVVDEVEVFMAHGHAELAINLLQEHVRATPDESPIPWMLLLDLLKRNKMAKEYAESGKACKQYFNIRVPELNEDEPGPGAAGLEAYPHILSELTRLWKSPECQAYLDDLIFDRRGGTRVGFDPPTFREIMLLRTIQMDEPSLKLLQA